MSGFNTVLVKSRVDGPIVEIAFHEGQDVHKGDVLANIDPATYRVALEQAIATQDKDAASLAQTRANSARSRALYEEGIISKQDFEKQEADLHEQEATARADQAAIDRASLDLSYTKIVAPIDGKVGLKSVDVGNIVHANDSTSIVTVTQIVPIAVVFEVPPDSLNRILGLLHKHRLRVEAFDDDGTTSLGQGEILATDSSIDSSTGAARIKALFPNKDRSLWPHEFVHIRLMFQ